MAKMGKKSSAAVTTTNVATLPVRGHRVGWIVGLNEAGWLVQTGPDASPQLARSILALDRSAMREAAASRREALIVFENELPDRPIVVGLLNPAPDETAPEAPAAPPATLDATVDGRRVVLDAQEEIVLRCGDASITLRRDGRVLIRGAYVETRSAGMNRIKGGSVRIN